LAKARSSWTDIHRHIVDGPSHDADQLALGLRSLKVKPTEHAGARLREVVLDEWTDAGLGPHLCIPVPNECTAMVRKVLQLKDQNLRNVGGNDAHRVSAETKAYLRLELLENRSKRKTGGPVKTRIQATIGIQTERGVHFGTTDWIKGRTLQFRSPAALRVNERVTLKIELPDGGEWVMAEATVIRTAASQHDETTRCMARISGQSTSHRKRLRGFLAGSSPQPVRLRDDQPIPLHEPIISLSVDGRNLTAKWSDSRAFCRDWALHISRGRLPASGAPPHRRAFMMRIMMPDGFVSTFPAEIGESLKDGWLVRFLVPHEAFTRMRYYAESRSRKVV
jgi:hypothetical protein